MVPTSLKVLGILGIIYSALAILGAPCGIAMTLHPLSPNPMTDQLYKDTVFVGYTVGASTLNFFLGVLLLASSIGCLKAKPWARMGMNVYALAHVLLTIVGTVFTLIYVLPKMKAALEAAAPGPGSVTPGAMEAIQIISLVFGILIVAGVALTILIIVNRKIAVDAFHGIFPADPTNFPVDYTPPLA